MAQYIPALWSNGEVFEESKIEAEFSAVATAFNTLNSTNHGASTVPVAALVNKNAEFDIVLPFDGSVGINQAYTTVRSTGVIFNGRAFTLLKVTAIATTVSGTVNVKLYYDGSAATNAIALTVARTGVTSTPTTTAIAADKILEPRFETSGSSSGSGVAIVLHCKAQHIA